MVLLPLAVQPGCARAQEDGREALRTGRYDDALAALRAEADAGSTAARRLLVRALLETGGYAEAERVALNGAPQPPAWMAALYGEALLAQGRSAEARRAFEAALRAADTPQRAGAPAADAASPPADTLRALLGLALLDWREGRRDAAFAAFDRFIDVYNAGAARSSDELAAVGVAVSHLGRRDPQLFHDANRAFGEAVARDPANHSARVLRGLLFLEKYNTSDAGALFREVLEQNPGHPGALLGMARVRMIEGAGDPGEMIGRALATNPALVEAHLLRARMQMIAERYDSAAASIERALAIDSSSLDAHTLAAANAYLRGDDWSRAVQAVLRRNPRHSAVYTTIGELAVQTRRYRDAVRMAERAVAVDSTDWSAHALRGLNLMRVGDVASARTSLEAAFAGDPFNVWVKNTLDLLDTYPEYVEHTTERFAFFLHRDEADLLFPYAAALAEEAYDALSERYGHHPETPVRVEIYPRHADFSVRTVGLAGLGALGVSFGSILAMDSPAAREPGSFHWGSTLWHEIAHAVTLGASAHRVPRWLTEGISVHEERRARPGWGDHFSVDFALAYATGRMRPPSELNDGFLRPRFPAEVSLSYYMASVVVEWIEETHGLSALRAMLQHYRDGRTNAEVVERVLDMTPARMDRAFDEWLRDRYGTQLGAVALEGGRAGGEFLEQLAAGRAALDGGDTAAAEQALQRALVLFPEYAGSDAPRRLLARIRLQQGDSTGAAELLTRHVAVAGTDLTAHLELARLRAALGDHAGAAEALTRAVYIHPYEPELHEQIAAQYEAAGNPDGVVRARAALVALAPVDRAEALYQLALAQHRAGDDAAARRSVLRALEIAPNYEAAQMLLLEVRR
jgi:tetratricopeptide (TPR) repeat protein